MFGGMATKRIAMRLIPISALARGVLAGIASYAQHRPDWTINSWAGVQAQEGQAITPQMADAVCGRITRQVAADWTGANRRRVVNVSRGWDVPGAANVTCDDAAIGRMGAEYLLDKGLEHFAWVGPPDAGRRYREFARTLRRRGHHVECFELTQREDLPAALRAWLGGLAPNTGLLAFNDDVAMMVMHNAAEAEVGIPDRLAVVGVDNDELQTMFAPVAVTSIDPDFVEVGRRAAEVLDVVLRGGDPPAKPIRVPPRGVVERASTDFPGELDPVALAAARLIRRRALEGITVDDLLAELPTTRRTLDRRFQEAFGRSIWQQITRLRMIEAKRLLSQTRLPMAEICRLVGYDSASHFSRLFGKEVGCTPSAYRKSQRMS